MKIEFDWSVDYIDNTTDELFPADKLNRAEYAKFLTQFLAKQGFDGTQEPNKQKKNYVLNLNAEWGAGKSYFLKRWSNDLKKHYPVVYIDVWKQDYSNDPLLTIVSAMTKQLKEQAGSNNTAINVPESISNLFKAALPSVANALAAKYLGLNISSLIESVEKADISEYDNIETGAIAQKITETLIKEHENKEKSIDILKLNIKEWVEAVVGQSATTENKKYYPAFIFIDELDRCKPSYAVEVLETIKHIFDIPGVIFVVATNTNQLQHTIKSVYGDGFDAIQYLGRFFNTRFAFGSQSFEKLLSVHCEISKLSNEYLSFKNISTFPDSLDQNTNGHIALKNLTTVYDTFLISSRQAIQITNRLIG
ncbi:TPA: KAP family P-loop NTPase fold protein, partial [Photobacterium damselae]